MKRLDSRIFTGFSAISFLLLVVTAVLWVRGYWVLDEFIWNQRTDLDSQLGFILRYQQISSSDGHFVYEVVTMPIELDRRKRISGITVPIRAGFVVTAAAILPIIWIVRRTLRPSRNRSAYPDRDKSGDTKPSRKRTTPDRCPECGTLVGKAET